MENISIQLTTLLCWRVLPFFIDSASLKGRWSRRSCNWKCPSYIWNLSEVHLLIMLLGAAACLSTASSLGSFLPLWSVGCCGLQVISRFCSKSELRCRQAWNGTNPGIAEIRWRYLQVFLSCIPWNDQQCPKIYNQIESRRVYFIDYWKIGRNYLFPYLWLALKTTWNSNLKLHFCTHQSF